MLVESWTWYATRAAGIVAYVLLWLTVLSGTLLTAKPFGRKLSAATVQDIHRILSFVTWSFVAVHAFVLLFDTYVPYDLMQILVPFTAPKDSLAVGFGVVAFEVGLVVAVSFRFRKRMGTTAWKLLHFASYPVWVLALVHGLMAGSEMRNGTVVAAMWASAFIVVFALTFRIVFDTKQALVEERAAKSAAKGGSGGRTDRAVHRPTVDADTSRPLDVRS